MKIAQAVGSVRWFVLYATNKSGIRVIAEVLHQLTKSLRFLAIVLEFLQYEESLFPLPNRQMVQGVLYELAL